VAGSILSVRSAMRHRMELAANAINANRVARAVRAKLFPCLWRQPAFEAAILQCALATHLKTDDHCENRFWRRDRCRSSRVGCRATGGLSLWRLGAGRSKCRGRNHCGSRQRTRLNVVDSDGTVIFFLELLKGGARLTRNLCALEKRPYLLIDTHKTLEPRAAAREIMEFVERHAIRVLNVSGARASRWPAGYEFVLAAMSECIHLSTKEHSLAEEGVPPQ